MYSFESRIRYSEIDYEGIIKFDAILDYYQDCSTFHSEELGVGMDVMAEWQVAWILSSWQVVVKRYPKMGEKIKIGTWPYQFRGFMGNRNFVMEDEEGKKIAYANSIWVLLDLTTGKPKKAMPQMLEAYQLEPQLLMNCESRKISVPKELKKYPSFPVHKYHIDTNMHVNNAKYILMAQEYLPTGFKIGQMRAEYRKAAVYGDVIYPSVSIGDEDGRITIVLANEEAKPYAVIELEKKMEQG
ncbi:thioesterase [Lachnospiraceae bacterium ZAX-1]